MRKILLKKAVLDKLAAAPRIDHCCDDELTALRSDILRLSGLGYGAYGAHRAFGGLVYLDDVLTLIKRRINALPVSCCRSTLFNFYLLLSFGSGFLE